MQEKNLETKYNDILVKEPHFKLQDTARIKIYIDNAWI